MFRTKLGESSRTLLYSVAVSGFAAIAMFYAAENGSSVVKASGNSANAVPQATFPADAGSLGSIPDGTSLTPCSSVTPKNVTFTVSGLSGTPSNVEVSMTSSGPAHTFVGDLIATLIAPNGASHVVFGRTGATSATSFGSGSDFQGPYNFKDSAAGTNWWTAAGSTPVPSGDYRSTVPGPTTNPAATTLITPDFSTVSNANGTWTLRFQDCASGDTGAISAASLALTTSAVTPADANVDFNGDGKTDYVVARATNSPLTEASAPNAVSTRPYNPDVRRLPSQPNAAFGENGNLLSPPIYWYTAINGSSSTGVGQLGDAATDFFTPEDFDGDGKDDPAVWTEAAATQASFKIFQSSTNTVRVDFFGQTGDDPAVVGDYDGDGKADPAVFRCPPSGGAAGQCYFFFRGSLNNPNGNITYVPWGSGVDGDFFPYVGDFDGDGKNDFCLQAANPSSPTNGLFYLAKSGGGVEYVFFGRSSDFIIPGDYDGDGKTDFCVRRSDTPTAGARTYYVLTRTGATSQIQWGLTGDVSTPGDYDGDGKTDFAIWRPSSTVFWILNSSNGSVTQFQWGQSTDFPVAGWAVH